MSTVDFKELLTELIKPLVAHQDDIDVQLINEEENVLTYHCVVNSNDLGRVIGKKGRVAASIRTIAYAVAIREKKHLEIEFLANEEEVSL